MGTTAITGQLTTIGTGAISWREILNANFEIIDDLLLGSQIYPSRTITAVNDDIEEDNESLIFLDGASNNITARLLSADLVPGHEYTFIRIDGTGNTVKITTEGSETIDGAPDLTLANQYDSVILTNNGSNWFTKSRPATASTSFSALSDTNITSPAEGEIPVYRSGQWVNEASGAGISVLSDLTDVNTAALGSSDDGQLLQWDGAEWVDVTLAEAGISALVHNHDSTDLTDFQEAVEDAVAALLTEGTRITLTYDDSSAGPGTLTIDHDDMTADDLTDVTYPSTGPSDEDVLVWNGSAWFPSDALILSALTVNGDITLTGDLKDGTNEINVQELRDAFAIAVAENIILSGGTATWTGSGLTFNVSAAEYYISGVRYSSAGDTITLDAADPSNARIDVIALDTLGAVVKITGTPSANPSKPEVDPALYVEVTFVTIAAAATIPSVSEEIIYDENDDWTTSTNDAAAFDVDAIGNPLGGSISIEGTNVDSSVPDYVDFTNASFNLSAFKTLSFWIESKGDWGAEKLRFAFFDSIGARISNWIEVGQGDFGFDSTITGSYQEIAIPMSAFALTSTISNKLRIESLGSGTAFGFWIDNIKMQTIATSSEPTNIWRTMQGDTGSTSADNSADIFNILGDGDKISTAISGDTLTVSLGPIPLSDLSDVNLSVLGSGDSGALLGWDGSKWIDQTGIEWGLADLTGAIFTGDVEVPGLRVGGSENQITIGGTAYDVHLVVHDEDAPDITLGLHKHSDTSVSGPIMEMARSRGTEASETAVQIGNHLGRISFLAFDGTDYNQGAEIRAVVDATPGADDIPTRIEILTTPDGSNTPVVNLAVLNSGVIQVAKEIELTERADHLSTPAAGKGYLWVKNTDPSTLIFTDDSGADTTLGSGGGGSGLRKIALVWNGDAVADGWLGFLHITGTITDFQMRCRVAPIGSAVEVDILGAGDVNHPLDSVGDEVSILSSPLSISAGSKQMTGDPWAFVSGKDVFTDGGYIIVKLTNVIGSGTVAEDIMVEITVDES